MGQALALLLARASAHPERIVLLAGQPAPARSQPAADPRVLAMNHGSRVLLDSLGAWPSRFADIRHVHISQRGRLGRTIIGHEDFGVEQLGSVVPYAALHDRLAERVSQSGVTVLSGSAATMTSQSLDSVHLAHGRQVISCRVAVQCDGTGGTDLKRDYGQHAVITSARASLPRPGWAWERFTAEGPLALLPHPQQAGSYSVVWCVAPERAQALATLDDAQFSAQLSAAFGERLGRLSSQAARHIFPLELKARHAQVHGRVATIGNAAQTLHPVAGQGLNLGLRDAAQLAQALSGWHAADDPRQRLGDFARIRSADRWLTAGLTDLMPRVFATGLAPVEHACGLALLALDLAAPARAPLARHLLQGLRA
ncbi:ubiquinone biosynthesis hydroxylase, UbiH/UbiF/VisC/COQ6 family protein [Bordetella holmesii 30539]|nr:ubiquinone biosynthesis hydroxylase, UbiH/UbiF/VisC/COQ6 family protein [Bordetella holmesii ATCC 51541]AIT24991.1 ubiquinone biosynthesis hydroxylase, UbiH/UbiF/VisC/COQ6 family protein [Bordetella holmesii 44057]EWM45553.1 ubiquinone biosynthesis hydroxylase, UbiH/UbiF/VisC/COQ6 family protein [Bordetella holmesii 70147]EWM48462.1 ubiquinone biosynthesis hydroxylase, UbiH/UbiF/VisC/COQ6 family protein [Bordetella holmesii 41130]EWM49677.1 ubiquinone biosynthesis hydroxylase, UbiH/UbiF/VisC